MDLLTPKRSPNCALPVHTEAVHHQVLLGSSILVFDNLRLLVAPWEVTNSLVRPLTPVPHKVT